MPQLSLLTGESPTTLTVTLHWNQLADTWSLTGQTMLANGHAVHAFGHMLPPGFDEVELGRAISDLVVNWVCMTPAYAVLGLHNTMRSMRDRADAGEL